MRVKICGITRLEDALLAVELGADALGFIFYEKSARYISPENAREISRQIPPFIERVGVFVHQSPSEINTICQKCELTLVQLHFDTQVFPVDELDYRYLRVVRAETVEELGQFNDSYRLLDAHVPEFGGEGKRLPLEWFENKDCSRMILAGGIAEENVSVIQQMGFYGIDLSSSVESSRGIKDHQKMRNFFERLHA